MCICHDLKVCVYVRGVIIVGLWATARVCVSVHMSNSQPSHTQHPLLCNIFCNTPLLSGHEVLK